MDACVALWRPQAFSLLEASGFQSCVALWRPQTFSLGCSLVPRFSLLMRRGRFRLAGMADMQARRASKEGKQGGRAKRASKEGKQGGLVYHPRTISSSHQPFSFRFETYPLNLRSRNIRQARACEPE